MTRQEKETDYKHRDQKGKIKLSLLADDMKTTKKMLWTLQESEKLLELSQFGEVSGPRLCINSHHVWYPSGVSARRQARELKANLSFISGSHKGQQIT